MSLDFTKLVELANSAKTEGEKIVEKKYGKANIAARKALTGLQKEAQALKKAITKLVSK